VLLEGVPDEVDLPEVERALLASEGVASLHDLHVWALSSGKVSLSVHVVSAPEVDDLAPLVQRLRALLAERAPGTHLYVCGPSGFMQAVRDAAAKTDWPEDALHAEYFAAPTDANTATGLPFTLKLARRGISVPVAADQTAVDALHEVGIDIPVSCQQGLCGTCVVEGDGEGAEHRDFCLTGSERRHKVALCCSRARGTELVLQL